MAARPRIRTRTAALIAGAVAVVVVAIAVLGWGVHAGWFNPGPVRGTTKGFVAHAAPAANPDATSWPEFGNAPESTRSNTALNVARPYATRWTVDAGSLVEFPPVIGDGRVVAGTNHGIAIALDVQTGHVDWTHRLGGRVAASPALTGLAGTASAQAPQYDLFATTDGDLVALDPSTGALKWYLSLGSPIESSPLVLGDSAYIGTRAGNVLRISLETHRAIWSVPVGGAVKGAIARSGSNVIVGDYSGHVTALRQTSGRVVWRTASPGPALRGSGRFYAGPAVAYGRVYIGNVNGYVLGINAADGVINWVQIVSNWVYSSAAVADRLVFVGSWNHNIYAMNAITGQIVWHHDLGQPISGSPSVLGDVVWVSTLGTPVSAGHGYAFDTRTGTQVAFRQAGRYAAAVAIAGTIIVTGVDTISALTPHTAS